MSSGTQHSHHRGLLRQASNLGEEPDPVGDRHPDRRRDRRHRADRAPVLPAGHGREGRGHAALYAARARRTQHLRARGLLPLPQPDDPLAARRSRALRPLLAGGREHVRPSLPMGLEAQWSRSRPRRPEIHRHLAGRASQGPALGRAAVDHAELRLPRRDAARYARARRST